MKKIISVILCIAAALCMLSACNTDSDNKDNNDSGKTDTAVFADFSYNGTQIKVNADASEIIKDLGVAKSIESFDAGCGDTARGYIYTYNGFEIRTDPVDDADLIDKITIINDLVSTPEGANIGMTSDEIKKIYGKPDTEIDEIIQYTANGVDLRFEINSNQTVVKITYTPSK